MKKNLLAKAAVTIDATSDRVWMALVDPKDIKQYFFGTDVVTDWRIGSPIVWKGEWKGKPYEDSGVVLESQPGHRLRYTHFSPLSGLSDTPENHHTIAIELSVDGHNTRVVLTQDNNSTEQERDHAVENWKMVLEGLKKFLES
jgi:uncharacterized protein YndB with AHSA1/START domain